MRVFLGALILSLIIFVGLAMTTNLIWSIPPIYRSQAEKYKKFFDAARDKYGLPDQLLERVAYQESRFNPDAVNVRSGAQGLMQFMPATAKEYGVNPFNPESAINGAARYLKWLRSKTNTWAEALAAYNWGIGNLRRKGLQNAPKETQEYYTSITNDLRIV